MDYVLWVILAVTFVAVCLGIFRFLTLRSNGIPVILRKLPASGNHGWRNGLLRYEAQDLKFYQLRSLSPMADATFHRFNIQLEGHRDLSENEASFFLYDTPVVLFTNDGVRYEAQMSKHASMAFVAWIESAPDARTDKMSPHELKRRMRNSK